MILSGICISLHTSDSTIWLPGNASYLNTNQEYVQQRYIWSGKQSERYCLIVACLHIDVIQQP